MTVTLTIVTIIITPIILIPSSSSGHPIIFVRPSHGLRQSSGSERRGPKADKRQTGRREANGAKRITPRRSENSEFWVTGKRAPRTGTPLSCSFGRVRFASTIQHVRHVQHVQHVQHAVLPITSRLGGAHHARCDATASCRHRRSLLAGQWSGTLHRSRN